MAMRYAVADVTVALDSVSQMCDAGAIIVFTKGGGYILKDGKRHDFVRKGDTYIRRTWLKKNRDNEDVEMTPVGFSRPGRKSP